MRLVSTLMLLAPLLALPGCPRKAGDTQQKAAEPCKKFGEQCEFAPGKLGSCVERSSCAAGESCLVCQSQH